MPVLVPKALGEPDAYETTLSDGTVAASLVYPGPVLVQTFKASARAVHREDRSRARTRWSDVRVGRQAGLLHHRRARVRVRGRNDDVNYEDQRIAGNTLLVEGDGLLLRIEGDITRDRALEIARSVQ